MDRFTRSNDATRLAITSVSSALAVLLLDAATRLFGSRFWGGVAAVLVVSLLALGADAAIRRLFERSVRIRKWIAGDDYLEGWWIDTAQKPDGGPPTHAAIQHVTFGENGFDVSGASF